MGLADYDPTPDSEGGRLFVGPGQVSVDVTNLDVVDMMVNLDYYTVDVAAGNALKNGKVVGPVKIDPPPTP